MTNVIICGIGGRMGRILYEINSKSDNFKIVAGIDKFCAENYSFPVYQNFESCLEKCDAVIDFSRPEALESVLNYCVKNKIPAVLCSTGNNNEHKKMIENACKYTAIFQSSNMSLGVNLLNELVKRAAEFLTGFDIEIVEKHHNKKADSPSGTALTIANNINSVFDGKKKYVYGRHSTDGVRQNDEIGIHALRGGTVVGEHEVSFFGNDEIITISHTALSKHVFAEGAYKAAEFISSKTAGLYSMHDMLYKCK